MRIREADLKVPALRLLSRSPNGFMTTAALILELEELLQPEGVDAEMIPGRGDSYFSQKVRNLVSHRGAATGLEARGLATYLSDREGWKIEDAGRRFVEIADAD